MTKCSSFKNFESWYYFRALGIVYFGEFSFLALCPLLYFAQY